MKKLNQLSKTFVAVWTKKWYVIPVLTSFVGLFFYFRYLSINEFEITSFSEFVSPTITIGTLIFTIIIGIQNITNKWESKLEKRLTVHFKIKDSSDDVWKYLLTCEKVSLASEADIRAFTQQIGSQMTNDTRNLKFDLNYDRKKQEIIKSDKIWVKHYEVIYYLKEFPSHYKKNNYKIWWWEKEEDENTTLKEIKKETLCEFISENLEQKPLTGKLASKKECVFKKKQARKSI